MDSTLIMRKGTTRSVFVNDDLQGLTPDQVTLACKRVAERACKGGIELSFYGGQDGHPVKAYHVLALRDDVEVNFLHLCDMLDEEFARLRPVPAEDPCIKCTSFVTCTEAIKAPCTRKKAWSNAQQRASIEVTP